VLRGYNHDETCLGYFTDYLAPVGGEEGVSPEQDAEFTGADGVRHRWELYTSPGDYIDLTTVYEETQKVEAYAACRLVSDSAREIVIGLGSNDGIKAWLNGEVIWDNHLPRGADADQDWVLGRVKEGANLLLLKIDQGLGDWGFYARVLDREEKEAELVSGTVQEMEVEYEVGNDHLTVRVGRNSRYLILDPLPACTVSIIDQTGATAETVSSKLGRDVSVSCENLDDGPYWVAGVMQLPNAQTVTAKVLYHRGPSKIKLRVYDRSGTDLPIVKLRKIEMLDRDFEVVPDAVRAEKPGIAGVRRPDVSPFHVRFLVESAALGRRYYLADNEGKGYGAHREGATHLDLPLEAANSLRARIRRAVAGPSRLPAWLRQNLRDRLRGTDLEGRDVSAAKVYGALDTLSTLKSRVASDGSVPVWYSPGIEKVANDEPVPKIDMDAAHVSVARNEYEPFQMVLSPAEDLRDLSIDFGPVKSQSGDTLDTSNLTVHRVEYVDVQRPTDDFGTVGPWPDPILPITEPFDATAGENTPLWVTVRAPQDQPAGTYRCEMRITSGGTMIAHIPVEIEVYDFTLPDETGTETAYGVSVNRAYHGPLSDDQAREVHDLYMQLCASHRISPYAPHTGAGIETRVLGTDPPRPVVDFTKFDAAMTRYLDEFKFTTFNMGGIPGELGGHPRYSAEYNRLFKDVYHQVQEHLREKGWLDKAYWYWVDEPPKSKYADVKKGLELLKTSCPDIRRLLTCNAEDAPVPYFFGLVDLWVPIMDRYVPERAHKRQRMDETVWWYVCTGPKAPYPNNFIDHPAINHRIRFWMIDRFGLDGSLYWSVTWWGQNPWEQAMSISPSGGPWGNGDGRLLYPPRRSQPSDPVVEPPVSTIRFESLRDGLEDREYFLLLHAIGAKKGSRADRARDIFSTVRRDIVPTMTCYEQNPAILLAVRHAIADAIAFGDADR